MADKPALSDDEIERQFDVLLDRYGPATAAAMKQGKISRDEAKAAMFHVLLGSPGGPQAIRKLLDELEPKRGRGQPQTYKSKAHDLNLLTVREMLRRLDKPMSAKKIARGIAEAEIDIEDREVGRKPNKFSRENRIKSRARILQNRISNASDKREMVSRWCELAEQGYSPEDRVIIIAAQNHK